MSSSDQILFLLCGPSGVGKTTIAHHLLEQNSDLEFSISYTTRPRRHNERDGVDYHFVDDATFTALRARGAFAECADVHGNRYGTTVATIEEAWSRGHNVLFDIDYQGAQQLRDRFGARAVVVLLLPPSMDALEQRLRDRGTDDDAVIRDRLIAAQHEIDELQKFADLVLVNGDRHDAIETVGEFYKDPTT